MSPFAWYSEIEKSDDLAQGDLIPGCPIPLPNNSVYQSIIERKEHVDEPIEVKTAYVAILTQACDIVQNKVSSIIVCPVWALDDLTRVQKYYEDPKARESLRQGKEPSYHLLNNYASDRISLDYSVVDFHRIYSLPKDFLRSVAAAVGVRLRLLPPYREHLSQAFARYFMRVGLPLDIDRQAIKNYKVK